MPPAPAYLPLAFTGLLFGCPFTTEAAECPLYVLRQELPAVRVRWLRTLSPTEQSELLARCSACQERRARWPEATNEPRA